MATIRAGNYENAVRHDKRMGSWIDKRDALNPLLRARVTALENTFSHLLRMRDEAWGMYGEFDPIAAKAFTTDEIAPVKEELAAVRSAFHCNHKHTDYGDDCLVCLDCGAEDNGLGWDYFFHAPIITTNNAATTQGHERGLKWGI